MLETRSLPTLFLCSFLLLSLPVSVHAQVPPVDDQADGEETVEPAWPEDSLGRRTPRGTVLGFIESVSEENYARAAQYLDLRQSEQPDTQGPERAQALQRLLDQRGNIIPRSLISNDSTGLVDDAPGPDLDLVGTAEADGETFDILVEKTEGPDGGPVWLFSSETIQKIPVLSEEVDGFTINQLLPDFLIERKWNGVPVGHWLAMLVLAVIAYLLARLMISVMAAVLQAVWAKAREEQTAEVIQAFEQPIRLYLAVWLFVWGSQNIGISIIVRQSFSEVTIIVGLVAFLLLLWQLIDVFARYTERRLIQSGQAGGLSAVLFFRRGIKFLLIAFGIISILNIFGWDVTTGLAALGIGGIALALGAQKTIENFVGSITIIADQPLRVGDFCKIDDTLGTVEQIGMRSTRLRTAARTVVVIPNGQLAAQKIENFAHRDRLLFNPKLGLRYETTPDQIRYLLVELRGILRSHSKVSPDPARVRFVGLEADSLKLEIFAYINTRDFNEFLEVQEDLILKIMDAVGESGTGFAFSSRTIYMATDTGLSEEKTQQAEQKVREWRDKGEL